MTNFRTLHLSGSLNGEIGGPPRALKGVVAGLIQAGIQTNVYVVESKISQSNIRGILSESGTRIHTFHTSKSAARYQLSFRLFMKYLQRHKDFDIVLAHGFYSFSLLFVLIASKWTKAQIYVMPHGSLENYQNQTHRFRKYIFRKLTRQGKSISAFLVATASEKAHLQSIKWITCPINVVGIPVLSDPGEDMNKPGESLSVGDYFLFIGRIASKKRVDLIIEAASILAREGLDFKIKIAGSGEVNFVDSLRKQVFHADLEGSFEFLGEVLENEKITLIRKSVATLLPSENENFAVSVAESIIFETPPIVSKYVALHEVTAKYGAGEVMASLSAFELAVCMKTVLNNRDKYTPGLRAARPEFDPFIIGQRLKFIFEEGFTRNKKSDQTEWDGQQ